MLAFMKDYFLPSISVLPPSLWNRCFPRSFFYSSSSILRYFVSSKKMNHFAGKYFWIQVLYCLFCVGMGMLEDLYYLNCMHWIQILGIEVVEYMIFFLVFVKRKKANYKLVICDFGLHAPHSIMIEDQRRI